VSNLQRYINNANISRFRLILQILAFLLLIYGGYLSIHIGTSIPTFACPYNQESPGTCYLISAQHQLHNTWSDLFGFRGKAFLTGFITFILLFLVINKAWCGYVCPLGTIQDWITKLRSFFGVKFSRYDELSFKRLKIIKFVLLILLVLMPLGMSNSLLGLPLFSHDLSAPFCQICPGRVITPLFIGDTSQLIVDFTNPTTMIMSTLGILVLALFFVGSFFKKRFFCFFCPMSALHSLFSRIAFLRLNKKGENCTRCGNCYRVCDVGIKAIADDLEHTYMVKDDCMLCLKCVEACPENDCLKASFLTIPVFSSTEEGFFKRNLHLDLEMQNPSYQSNNENETKHDDSESK
jgi:ferredoxin-type protein NapH